MLSAPPPLLRRTGGYDRRRPGTPARRHAALQTVQATGPRKGPGALPRQKCSIPVRAARQLFPTPPLRFSAGANPAAGYADLPIADRKTVALQ